MSTYTSSLGLELITPGSQAGLWGNTTNNSLNLIDQAITGVTPLNFASASGTTQTLTDYNGAADQARSSVLNVTGTASGTNTVVIPNKQKTYFVRNATGQDIVFQTAVGTTPCTVGAGYNLPVFCDGNNNVFLAILAPGAGTLTVTGGGTGVTTFGSGGFIKSSGGTNALTAHSTVNAASELSGAVPVANGGTGAVSLINGGLVIGQGTSAVASLTGGVVGYVPTWNGSTWVSAAPSASGVSSIAAGTGISVSGSTGAVTVTNSGVTSISAGTGITVSGSTGSISISASGSGVASFSAGTTGFTPTSSSTGAIVLGGTLNVANGGTGATTLTSGSILKGNGASAISAATSTDIVNAIGATAVTNSNQLGGVVAASYLSKSTNMENISASYYFGGTSLTAPVAIGASGVRLGSAGTFAGGNSSQLTLGLNSGATTFYLYNTGNATAPGTWQSLSDARLKENVTPIANGLNIVNQLNPVKFSMKRDGLDSPNRYGMLAQELELVVPEAVNTTESDYDGVENIKAVAYTELIPILVKAIQELKAEVDALKAAK